MSLRGIDISQWEATTPPLNGLSFVIIRATYGRGYDTGYAAHAADVRAAGLALGAYAFGVNDDGAAQAQALLATAPDADFYVLDLETETGKPAMTAAQARAFIDEMHRQGHKIGLYHSLSGFVLLGQDWNWVAAWDGIVPDLSPLMTDWTFHQYSGGPLDHDVFAGDDQELAAFLASQEITVTASKIPTDIMATEPVMLGAGIVTALVYVLQAAGIITVPEAQQLGPQLNAVVVAAWPLMIMIGGYIGRHYASSPVTVARLPSPPTVPGGVPTTPVRGPIKMPPAPTAPGGAPVPQPVIVVSTTPLPVGQTGTIKAGTSRWLASNGQPLSDIGPSIIAFDAEVELSGSLNGHFWRSTQMPPVYVAKWAITPLTASPPALTVINATTLPAIFASSPAASVSVPFVPDTSGDPDEDVGNGFTWRSAVAWWTAFAAAPFDERLLDPSCQPGTKILTPEQLAMFRQVGETVLPPPPTNFPFPLKLNPNFTASQMGTEIMMITMPSVGHPKFDPRVSFTSAGIVVAR